MAQISAYLFLCEESNDGNAGTAFEVSATEMNQQQVAGIDVAKAIEVLDVDSSDPPDGGQLVLVEEVVGLVVEAPLAERHVGSALLQTRDLVGKVLLFHLVKGSVVFS